MTADGEEYLTLNEAAGRLHICGKTLSDFLRKHPAEPPLFAKPGRDYLISRSDVERIYEKMKDVSAAGRVTRAAPAYTSHSERRIFESLRKLTSPEASKSRPHRGGKTRAPKNFEKGAL